MTMMQDDDNDDNSTAQLHVLSWPLGQISKKVGTCPLDMSVHQTVTDHNKGIKGEANSPRKKRQSLIHHIYITYTTSFTLVPTNS